MKRGGALAAGRIGKGELSSRFSRVGRASRGRGWGCVGLALGLAMVPRLDANGASSAGQAARLEVLSAAQSSKMSFRILGSRLTDPGGLDARRVNILITGVPAALGMMSGQCIDIDHTNAPSMHMSYWDGVRGTASLKAQGFISATEAITGIAADSFSLCRDAKGAITLFGAEVTLYQPGQTDNLCQVVASRFRSYALCLEPRQVPFGLPYVILGASTEKPSQISTIR